MTDTANAPEREAANNYEWQSMSDWSGMPDVYVTKVECQSGLIWRIEACSVPMAIGPEVRLVNAKELAELRSDRPFIVGWNEGFAEAEYQQANGKPSDGDLSPQYQHTAKEMDEAQAKIARLTEVIEKAVNKLEFSADIIRRNYLHQPEKCADARSICSELALLLRAALQENADE